MEKINKLLIDLLNEGKYEESRYIISIDDELAEGLKNSDVIEFTSFCLDHLGIDGDKPKVKIVLTKKPEDDCASFAYYKPTEYFVYVNCKERHKLDIFRSLAHELVHYKQDVNGELNDMSQLVDDNDGVPIENEANSIAGVIMREYGRKRPEFFK